MMKIHLAALCLVAAATTPLWAAELPEQQSSSASRDVQGAHVVEADDSEAIILTMPQALRLALDENLTVQTAREDVERAKGDSKAASAALLPTLTVNGEANAYDMANEPDNEALARAEITQSIYSGGRNSAVAQQGKLGIRRAEHNLYDVQETVAKSVWDAFCDVLYRKEVLRTTQDALDYYLEAEQELIRRVEFGLSTNLDLVRVRQQKEAARADYISAGNDLEASRIALCTLLRLPPQTRLELSGDLSDGLPELASLRPSGNGDKSAADLERTLERRGDYQELLAAQKIQEKEITVARSGMLPDISLSAGYRFARTANGGTYSTDDDQWSASLVLSIPLYDGGLTSGNVKSAKSQLEQAKQAVLQLEEQIRADLVDARLTLMNALETVEAGNANLVFAKESLRYAEVGYREGVNTQLDVLQARSDLTQAGQDLAGYLRDSRVAQANLWLVMGELVEHGLSKEEPPAGNLQVDH